MVEPKTANGSADAETLRASWTRAERACQAARAVLRVLPGGDREATPHLDAADSALQSIETALGLPAAGESVDGPTAHDPQIDPGLVRLEQLAARLTRAQESLDARHGPDPIHLRRRRFRHAAVAAGVGVSLIGLGFAVRPRSTPWRGRYFSTPDQQGRSVQRDDAALDFDWGTRRPVYGVQGPSFSVRWDSCLVVDERLPVSVTLGYLGGARVWLDGEPVVEGAPGESFQEQTGVARPGPGTHHVRVDYRAGEGGARFALALRDATGEPIDRYLWHPDDPDAPALCHDLGTRLARADDPAWLARYYPRTDFSGTAVIRPAAAVEFDWQHRAPIKYETPSDGFSARFDTCLDLPQGADLQFVLRSDDGSRARVGGEVVVDNWGVHGIQESRGTRTLDAGIHHLRVEYFDEEGGASVQLRVLDPDGSPLPPERYRAPDPAALDGDPCARPRGS